MVGRLLFKAIPKVESVRRYDECPDSDRLTSTHVRFGRVPPYSPELAIFPFPYNRELVRSHYFPWSEHLVSSAVRSWPCLSAYVVII